MKQIIPQPGDELTIAQDIVSLSGSIIYAKSQKVIVREIIMSPGFYGKSSGQWYEGAVKFIRLMDTTGDWMPDTFTELQTN